MTFHIHNDFVYKLWYIFYPLPLTPPLNIFVLIIFYNQFTLWRPFADTHNVGGYQQIMTITLNVNMCAHTPYPVTALYLQVIFAL